EAVRGQRTASAFEDWSVGSLFSLRHGYSILRDVAFSGRKRPDRQLLRILRSALVYSWETASSITRQAPGSRPSHRAQDSGRVLQTRPKSAVGRRSRRPRRCRRRRLPPSTRSQRIRAAGQGARTLPPGEPQAGLPLVEFHVLDHVVRGVLDEVPGALAAYHLDELVLEGGPAHSRVHGDGASNRECAFLVVVVDRVGLLGLVEDRLTLAVLRRGKLEGLEMHLGAALEYVQISRGLNLKLLQFKKDHDIRLEVTRGVGGVGPLGMTLNPGPHLV